MLPLLMLLGVIGLQAGPPVRGQDKDKAVDPVRSTITKAISWIARQAVPLKDESGGVLFPESAETPERRAPQIYGGTAGVLLFLENAASVLNDARARALADATVKGLLATRTKTDEGALTW